MVARTFKSVVVAHPFLVYVFGVRMPLPGHCECLTRGATCCGAAAPGSRAAEETQGLKGKGSTATVDPLGSNRALPGFGSNSRSVVNLGSTYPSI